MIANTSLNRWIPAALLAAALGAGAALLPARAQAADVQVRVLVDVADLIFRSGRPYYYERGHYHPVVVEYDPWRRPVYYRYAPRPPVVVYKPRPVVVHHHAPPHYRAGWRDRDRDWDRRGWDRRDWDRGGRGKHGRGHGHGRGWRD